MEGYRDQVEDDSTPESQRNQPTPEEAHLDSRLDDNVNGLPTQPAYTRLFPDTFTDREQVQSLLWARLSYNLYMECFGPHSRFVTGRMHIVVLSLVAKDVIVRENNAIRNGINDPVFGRIHIRRRILNSAKFAVKIFKRHIRPLFIAHGAQSMLDFLIECYKVFINPTARDNAQRWEQMLGRDSFTMDMLDTPHVSGG